MADSIVLISVPYDSGHRMKRLGRGSAQLIDSGLAERIRQEGRDVTVTTLESALALPTENSVAFEMHDLVAQEVRKARTGGTFPLILSGNCNYAAIGAVTGLGTEDTAVLWFDAHGESETPETSESAFLDGMGMAILVGQCWRRRAAGVPGFVPLDPRRAVMIGARDLSSVERALFPRLGIGQVPVEAVRSDRGNALIPELDRLRGLGVRRLYVHIDADVYDPDAVGHANLYSASAGPGLLAQDLIDCLSVIGATIPIDAAAVTAYDPEFDPHGRMQDTLTELSRHLADLGSA
ncbi:arginase family protein [Microbaculum marinum]|uniref:Arginase family protein n=1 Tax=Microbaculum marinum TaxID=1764581 RepID=A0AAW9RWR1_9HYPH